ncbi:hypothetical protein [Nocardia asiatica]|uniref:hypothetical protein n=1 Tax=Nocardia asiatica TaxID=209252 RepID=UPI0024565792|nr:hypothetical protein [Nocardia asiatica]
MNESDPRPEQPDVPEAVHGGVPVAGVHASGPRAVAVGGNAGVVQTGDNSRIVQLPAEAWQPIAEVDAPPGIDNLPVQPGHGFVGRAAELGKLDTVLAAPGRVVVQAVHGLGGIGKAPWPRTGPPHAPTDTGRSCGSPPTPPPMSSKGWRNSLPPCNPPWLKRWRSSSWPNALCSGWPPTLGGC